MLAALLLLPLVSAGSLTHRHDSHEHLVRKALPGTWHHARDHPVNALFKRGTDGETYPEVGTPTWASAYPESTPDSSKLPDEWVQALNDAVKAGSIPNIPQSTNTPGVNPVYPTGHDAGGPEICSGTAKCRNPGDIWDAPDGYFGVGFDDGPQTVTSTLLDFLNKNDETATHYMIGVNILGWAKQFTEAYEAGGDIAVHTWTHPYMTTLSNLDVVAQLGWTMEIIHNSTGGRVPKFWRPPFGDSDNRVRAIASEVFGLTTLMWNQDTEDWSLTTGGTTPQIVNASMTQWITGPKSPGLIILEHELSDASVKAFTDAYPLIKSNGWKTLSQAQLAGNKPYQNADSTDSDSVTPSDILASDSSDTDSGSSAGSSGSASPSSSGTGTGTSASQKTTSTVGTSASSASSSTPTSDNQASNSAATTWTRSLTASVVLGFVAIVALS